MKDEYLVDMQEDYRNFTAEENLRKHDERMKKQEDFYSVDLWLKVGEEFTCMERNTALFKDRRAADAYAAFMSFFVQAFGQGQEAEFRLRKIKV